MSEDTEVEGNVEDALSKLLLVNTPTAEPEMRAMTIMGDINEELSKDIIAGLWFLNHSAKVEEPVNPEDPECNEYQEVVKPFEVIISTNGGNADEMFAIYDTMRWIRENVEIETFGLGKVMSAGTLLLAAGTKGKRKIIQESYIKAICEETKLTERKLRTLLKKKVNIYLTAEEAVEYGFADIIVQEIEYAEIWKPLTEQIRNLP